MNKGNNEESRQQKEDLDKIQKRQQWLAFAHPAIELCEAVARGNEGIGESIAGMKR